MAPPLATAWLLWNTEPATVSGALNTSTDPPVVPACTQKGCQDEGQDFLGVLGKKKRKLHPVVPIY
jgi:hypothetical protein